VVYTLSNVDDGDYHDADVCNSVLSKLSRLTELTRAFDINATSKVASNKQNDVCRAL